MEADELPLGGNPGGPAGRSVEADEPDFGANPGGPGGRACDVDVVVVAVVELFAADAPLMPAKAPVPASTATTVAPASFLGLFMRWNLLVSGVGGNEHHPHAGV